MNVIFVEPFFPANQRQFARTLATAAEAHAFAEMAGFPLYAS